MKKSQRGITLISLTIYIIVLVMVIAMVSVVSSYFFKNMNQAIATINPLTEYTKLDSFLTEEVNHKNIKVLECEDDYIVFDNDVQYTFIPENQGVYRNMVKICEDVQKCTFKNIVTNGKEAIMIRIQIGTANAREVEYILAN